jgi:hypothetical protein
LFLTVSFVYVLACRLFELVGLLARGERSKELEIFVLRHELSILRRQVRRVGCINSARDAKTSNLQREPTYAPHRLDPDSQPCADLGLPGDRADERVPLRVGVEVGQHLPHTLGWSIDLDLGAYLSHLAHVSPGVRLTSAALGP